MKKIVFALAFVAMFSSVYGCGRGKGNSAEAPKSLVAYFSATGTTAAVAQQLSEVTGASLYQIKPEVPYTAEDLDWRDKESRSSLEMADPSSRPSFVKDLEDASSFDVIYIGFPVWWYTAPRIINSFIEEYGFEGKTVVLFATSGGSDLSKANEDFREAYPEIVWKPGRTLNGETSESISSWVESLK